jgi:hypothetical protein
MLPSQMKYAMEVCWVITLSENYQLPFTVGLFIILTHVHAGTRQAEIDK